MEEKTVGSESTAVPVPEEKTPFNSLLVLAVAVILTVAVLVIVLSAKPKPPEAPTRYNAIVNTLNQTRSKQKSPRL